MTQLLARGVVRVFRLTNERGGLGLSCTPAGVSLAGVPLLRRAHAEFVPRTASEVALLLKAAYGKDLPGLQSRLGAIAQALNSGDFALAMIAARPHADARVEPRGGPAGCQCRRSADQIQLQFG